MYKTKDVFNSKVKETQHFPEQKHNATLYLPNLNKKSNAFYASRFYMFLRKLHSEYVYIS